MIHNDLIYRFVSLCLTFWRLHESKCSCCVLHDLTANVISFPFITYIKLLTVSIDGFYCHVLLYIMTFISHLTFFFCSGIFEINCSKDLKIQGIIGPCASLEKVCVECLTSFLLLISTT